MFFEEASESEESPTDFNEILAILFGSFVHALAVFIIPVSPSADFLLLIYAVKCLIGAAFVFIRNLIPRTHYRSIAIVLFVCILVAIPWAAYYSFYLKK